MHMKTIFRGEHKRGWGGQAAIGSTLNYILYDNEKNANNISNLP